MESSPENLREQFFAALDRPGERAGLWLDIWRLFVDHPWYQAELQSAACRLLARAGIPAQWTEDIQQDAMLLLAKHLSHAADLHVDRAQAAKHFSGWMATIILRDCQQALRTLRSQRYGGAPLPAEPEAARPGLTMESRIDLSMAIEKLPDPARTVVALYSQGWPVREIAARLRISYWQANRALHNGLASLSKVLRPR